MKLNHRRNRPRHSRMIESLEPRCLLSATNVATITSQQVATGSGPTTLNLASFMADPQLTGGTVVVMQTPLGNIPLQLYDTPPAGAVATPGTVTNFLKYINNGQYTPTVINRSNPGFVLQGGGTKPDGSNNTPTGNIPGEPGNSNTVGTIAMALSSGPNSGSNQWFINLGNNPILDGSANGGPFTVFGNVIDAGMNVASAIAQLPTIDASAENSQWALLGPTFPVINYTGPNPATANSIPIPQSNIVTDNIVAIPAGQAITYTATSDNPNIVTASVSNGQLTLNAAPGVTGGQANVTVTATDLSGQSVSQAFTASVNGFFQAITIGAGGAKAITHTDVNGTVPVISLKGPGNVTINYQSDTTISQTAADRVITVTSPSPLKIHDISIGGTNATSTLTIATNRGARTIDIATITTETIKAINARGVVLTSDLTASGPIGTLSLLSAQGGTMAGTAIGTLTTTGAFSDTLRLGDAGVSINRFSAGTLSGTWGLSGSVNSLTAGSATDWTPTFTGSVKNLAITKGDLTGVSNIIAASIASLRVKGALNNTVIQVTSAGVGLGRATIGGAISGSTLSAAGSIGPVSAASLLNSKIFAGVAALPAGQPLPNTAIEFATMQTIASVRLRTLPASAGFSFSNSEIAATSTPSLSLGTIQTANGGAVSGVASEAIKTLTGIANGKRFALRNLTSATDVNAALAKFGLTLTDLADFKIKLF